MPRKGKKDALIRSIRRILIHHYRRQHLVHLEGPPLIRALREVFSGGSPAAQCEAVDTELVPLFKRLDRPQLAAIERELRRQLGPPGRGRPPLVEVSSEDRALYFEYLALKAKQGRRISERRACDEFAERIGLNPRKDWTFLRFRVRALRERLTVGWPDTGLEMLQYEDPLDDLRDVLSPQPTGLHLRSSLCRPPLAKWARFGAATI